ncbi:MAG: hypothetical protein M0T86_03365 [Betaproteobacteria bacterium]|nr:hypothetical protein [Betaproteobacteria bacterium]
MTFNELLDYLLHSSKYDIADGDRDHTLNAALDGSHKNPVAGHILAQLYQNSQIASPGDALERVQAVKALGPVRLHYMKDDAPVEGFRMVEDIVHKIDGAYNDEALRQKS